jgi:hypothetical protein
MGLATISNSAGMAFHPQNILYSTCSLKVVSSDLSTLLTSLSILKYVALLCGKSTMVSSS